MTEQEIYAIERPHPNLLKWYFLKALATGPFVLVLFPMLFFRYRTLRYRFDEEGVHVAWGVLFRKEINLTYARIQDIHLRSNVFQRWFGLADLDIQTASGSAEAEMRVEGLLEYEAVRSFLYARMRGQKDDEHPEESAESGDEVTELLREVAQELRATREALTRD